MTDTANDFRPIFPFTWESNAASSVSPRESASIYQLERYRRSLPQNSARHWQAEILTRVLALTKLPQNWNTYGAARVRADTALFAMLVLENIMEPATPLPDVVPTSSGGLQFEWHEFGIDFEIQVLEPNRCEYSFEDLTGEFPDDSGPLANEFFALARPIKLLTSRAGESPVRRRA